MKNVKFSGHFWLMTLLSMMVLGVSWFISQIVFKDYPFSMDEYAYLYQAKIFASGHLWLPVKKSLSGIFELYMIYDNGRLFTKYPPGCSMLLAVGVKTGLPGIINPILATATIIIIYCMSARFFGRLYAFLGVCLLATNSYFLCYSASYFAQPASLFFSSLAWLFYFQYKKDLLLRSLAGASLSIAALTLVRPVDALCLALVFMGDILLQTKKEHMRPLISYIFLSSSGAVLLLIYNFLLVHRWTVAPYPVFSSDFRMVYGDQVPFFKNVTMFLKDYISFIGNIVPLFKNHFRPFVAGWLILACIGLIPHQKQDDFKNIRPLLFWYAFLLIAFYNVHPSQYLGWPQYGARYWYVLITPLILLTIDGLRRLDGLSSRRILAGIAVVVLILLQTNKMGMDLNKYSQRFKFVLGVYQDIERTCPEKSLVVIKRSNIDLNYWWGFQRNMFYNGQRIYITDQRVLGVIQPNFPDYSVCRYTIKKEDFKKDMIIP